MIPIFLRWGVPAVVTVLVGTAAAVLGNGTDMPPPDLRARALGALRAAHIDWADVRFDLRDAYLIGTPPSRSALESALTLVADVQGVRSVSPTVAATDASDTFVFRADFDGKAVTLSGRLNTAADLTVLTRAAGVPVTSTARPATDAPQGFADLAGALLGALVTLKNGHAEVIGTTALLSGEAPDAETSAAIAKRLSGFAVKLTITLAAASTPPTPVVTPYAFTVSKAPDGRVATAGTVPNRLLDARFVALAGTSVTNGTTIAEGAPADFAEGAVLAVEALTLLTTGTAMLSGEAWTIKGEARDALSADRLRSLIAIKGKPERWILALNVPIVAAVPAPQPKPKQPAADDSAARAACATSLAALAAQNALVFKPGSATLLDTSNPALDALAADLAACPHADVNVEGHTDTDGEADINLELSVARAEAVIAALIERGVSPDRLYAVGYGETRPIASNDTKSGKQANRRIAFSLVETDAATP
jgi:outer membrane protein OmpA-like peptidoglycan-associated protein